MQRGREQGWSQVGAPGFAPCTHKRAFGRGSALAVGMRSSSQGRKEREGEGAGIKDAHAWYSPGEVLIPEHVPRDGRVPRWSHLGRDGVGRLALNTAQVAQTGVMAYVVVSQG